MLERLRARRASTSTSRTYAAPPTAPRRPGARTSPTRWSRSAWCRTATRRSGSYLSPGRPAYVNRYAAPLVEMIRIVERGRGGGRARPPVGPARPRTPAGEATRRARAGSGWPGIEVDHQDHTPADRRAAARDRPAASAWWSPAPATTTASEARSRARLQHHRARGVRAAARPRRGRAPPARARRHARCVVRRRLLRGRATGSAAAAPFGISREAAAIALYCADGIE